MMNKIPLLTTGANGLVGSHFIQTYAPKYEVDSLELSHPTNPVDITDESAVMNSFATSAADTVIHLAAFTDVTKAWEQRDNKEGVAYQVNVVGTKNIIKACEQFNKYLIYISTAYVFDGKKTELYTETDTPHPIEWYGQTKFEAEQLIAQSEINWTILRIDQPFRSDAFPKLDLAHRLFNGLRDNNLYPMFIDHYFGPTFIDDFTQVLNFFVEQKTTGLFHATSGEQWTDYEFAQALKEIFQLPGEVKAGKLADYLKTLNRPYQKNTALSTAKLTKILPFKQKNIREAIKLIKF